jgi:hypothetical protein
MEMTADLPKDMIFDVRILERNVRKGIVTEKDVEKHLKELADRTEASAPVETKLERHAQDAAVVSPRPAARSREEEEGEID